VSARGHREEKPIDPNSNGTTIELVGVTQHYGVRPVLKNVSLAIERGRLVVIIGPNGMGKSTLLSAMGGVLQPQHGYVAVAGLKRRGSVEDEIAIRRLAVYLPDHPWLPANRTGREFLLSVGQLYDVSVDRVMDHAQRLLALFELSDQADSPIRSYSGGQQKKIALCSALVTEAPILLLDEPFSGGLDPSGLLALKRVLQRRVRDQGATVVLTSPVPEIVEEIADRVIILRNGEVIAYDSLEGLRRLTGQHGSLAKLLEHLMYPETSQNLKNYFEGFA
jgi:ABC-type multidrug transport system ATPase subunit